MRRKAVIAEGEVLADAFVLDAPQLGAAAARDRALALHRPGATYAELPDGRWLVRLPAPTPVEAVRAPGLPLVARAGALVAEPGLDGPTGSLVAPEGGRVAVTTTDGAATLDPVTWVDLGGLPVVELRPSVAPPPPAPEVADDAPSVDLRGGAALGTPSRRAQQVLDEFAGRAASAGRAGGRSGSGPAAAPRPQPLRDRIIRAFVSSPFGAGFSRRQEQYLRELVLQFNRRDYPEALRNAIGLGGAAGEGLTMRLPGRRADLALRRTESFGGRSVPFGGDVSAQLRAVYRAAAEDLDSAGRVDEAAFVLADLLEDPAAAVALLERSGRFADAARLAEDRTPASGDAVRLWWRAGDRGRAVALARRHGHFAIAVDRLEQVDPAAASSLRLEWVASLEASGAVRAAVETGWADPAIRPLLGNLLTRGLELGGPDAARLEAYRLALVPSEELVVAAEDRVREWSAAQSDELRAFLLALTAAPLPDAALDRRITSAALRATAATAWPPGDGARLRAVKALRPRADPVLVADLPAPLRRSRSNTLVVSQGGPGSVVVSEAAPLPGGRILLALGALGTRLVTADGRTAAQWDVPTHRLVVADHGGTALLLAPRGEGAEVHHLDLGTRRVRRYGGVRGQPWMTTCDGSWWLVVDERGIAFYDLHEAEPVIRWRELDQAPHLVARTADAVAALVETPFGVEVLRWDAVSMRLADRRQIPSVPTDAMSVRLGPDGTTHWLGPGGRVDSVPMFGGAKVSHLPEGGRLEVVGDLLVRCWPEAGDWRLDIGSDLGPSARTVVVEMGKAAPSVRAAGNLVSAWDDQGRVVVVDVAERSVVSRLSVVG